MKRLDDSEEENYVKCCVYGQPGTGKTSFGVSAPKPLIILTERQGMVHIKQASKRLGVPTPLVLLAEEARDLRNIMRGLQGDKSKPFRVVELHETGEGANKKTERYCVHESDWPETVVLDSATDALRLLSDEINREAPPKKGNDGLPVPAQRYWNTLEARAQAMILAFRDLPLNLVMLALEDDRTEGEDDAKVRIVRPMVPMKKLATVLLASVNVVGRTYRKTKRARAGETQNSIEYGIMTTGPEYMMLKPYRPLRDTERPDFGYWVKVLRGEQEELPAPSPSESMGGGEVGPEDQAGRQQEPEAEASARSQDSDASAESAPADTKPKTKPKTKRRAG